MKKLYALLAGIVALGCLAASLDFSGRITITGKQVVLTATINTNGDDMGTPVSATNSMVAAYLWRSNYVDWYGTNNLTAVGTVQFTNAGIANYPTVLHFPYSQANYLKSVHTLSTLTLAPTDSYTVVAFFRLMDTNTLHGICNVRASAGNGNSTDIQIYYTPIDLDNGGPTSANVIHVGIGSMSAATFTDVETLGWGGNGYLTNWLMVVAMKDSVNGKMIAGLMGRGTNGCFNVSWNTNTWNHNNNGTITNFYVGLGWPPSFAQFGWNGQLGPIFVYKTNISEATCYALANTNATSPCDMQGLPWNFSNRTNIPPDITPPVIHITSPTNGPTYSTTNSQVSLAGDLFDNIGVVSMTWSNALTTDLMSIDVTNAMTWAVTNVTLQTGDNPITVRAYDAAGNAGSALITVTATIDPGPTNPVPVGWFVAPNGGTFTASGTNINDPLRLDYAMSGAQTSSVNRIQPGNVIYLRGGSYTGRRYTNTVSGTFTQPVVWTNYPGEKPLIYHTRFEVSAGSSHDNDECIKMRANNNRFFGLEFRGDTFNFADFCCGDTAVPAPSIFGAFGSASTNNAIINCVFRNVGMADYVGGERHDDLLFYGNWHLNTGTSQKDHTHYWHNSPSSSAFIRSSNEVFIGGFQLALHAHAGDVNQTKNFSVDNGIFLNNQDRNLYFSNGQGEIDNIHVRGCVSVNIDSATTQNSWMGNASTAAGAIFHGLILSNNWFIGGSKTCDIKWFNPVTVRSNRFVIQPGQTALLLFGIDGPFSAGVVNDNTYYGAGGSTEFRFGTTTESDFQGSFTTWKTITGYDNNSSYFSTPLSSGTSVWVRVYPNAYETGANIFVANWPTNNTVTVDLSNVFTAGDTFTIAPGFNLDVPCVSGTYSGSAITIPLTNMAPVAHVHSLADQNAGPTQVITNYYVRSAVHTNLNVKFGAFRARKTMQ